MKELGGKKKKIRDRKNIPRWKKGEKMRFVCKRGSSVSILLADFSIEVID